jgi:hypothetical protein
MDETSRGLGQNPSAERHLGFWGPSGDFRQGDSGFGSVQEGVCATTFPLRVPGIEQARVGQNDSCRIVPAEGSIRLRRAVPDSEVRTRGPPRVQSPRPIVERPAPTTVVRLRLFEAVGKSRSHMRNRRQHRLGETED